MPRTIDQEVDLIIKKLKILPKEFTKKKMQKLLAEAAEPLLEAAKSNVPTSLKTHYRYKTSKASRKFRAPKGKGNRIASYEPGNLKNALRILKFRRSSDVFVGPKVAKRGAKGRYGRGRRVDGYYAAWIEYGTSKIKPVGYMRRALASKKSIVQARIIGLAKSKIKEFGNKNRIA